MNKNLVIALLVVSTLLFGALYIGSQVQLASEGYGGAAGPTKTETQEFLGGFTVGTSGTTINKYLCSTATWDPGAAVTSTPVTLDIANTGAALGDPCVASFDSATTTDEWDVSCTVTGSATSTIKLKMVGGSGSINLSASTAKVCTIQ